MTANGRLRVPSELGEQDDVHREVHETRGLRYRRSGRPFAVEAPASIRAAAPGTLRRAATPLGYSSRLVHSVDARVQGPAGGYRSGLAGSRLALPELRVGVRRRTAAGIGALHRRRGAPCRTWRGSPKISSLSGRRAARKGVGGADHRPLPLVRAAGELADGVVFLAGPFTADDSRSPAGTRPRPRFARSDGGQNTRRI